MAVATRTTRDKVTKRVEQVPVVVLELDENEASTLLALFAFVGGNPENTARGYVNGMSSALKRVMPTGTYLSGPFHRSASGSIMLGSLPDELRPKNTQDEVVKW